ncbi:MAG TPA: hypothetical protein VFS58_06335 [Steroidobacteraceae bacterium]|nr:hypothetical protein [Steroidobacteraceae bacterium]
MALISLAPGSRISLSRQFHVEILRGGMNRLLLRSTATRSRPTRLEVYFPYVQHLDLGMRFDELTISCEAGAEALRPDLRELIRNFPECHLFRLESKGAPAGYVVAAHCMYGEDDAPAGSDSMFPVET